MKGNIKINTELCKGCAFCVDACPADVISMRKRFNKSGYFPAVAVHIEKCTGCAMCARMCPEIAIEVYRKSKPKNAGDPKRKLKTGPRKTPADGS